MYLTLLEVQLDNETPVYGLAFLCHLVNLLIRRKVASKNVSKG